MSDDPNSPNPDGVTCRKCGKVLTIEEEVIIENECWPCCMGEKYR
jgi:hypothetical protein